MPNWTKWKRSWWSHQTREAGEREGSSNEKSNKYTIALFVLVGIGAFVLQTSLLHYLPLMPDLLLIFCVYLGIHHRSAGGATGAFILGYGLDSCSGAPIGMNAFAMSLIFAVVALASRRLWLPNPLSVLSMVLLAVVLKAGAFVFLSEIGYLTAVLQPMVARYVMWDAAVALLLTPLVFAVLYRGEALADRM